MAAGKIAAAIIVILLILGGSFFYSYSQLSVDVSQLKISGVELAEPSLAQLAQLGLALISGNPLGIAMSLVESIVVEGVLEVNNPGFLPVNIPEAQWALRINGIEAGFGEMPQEMIVSAGSTGIFPLRQEITLDRIPDLAAAIVATGGELDLVFDGTLETRFLILPLSISFTETATVSLAQEIENRVRAMVARVVGGGPIIPEPIGVLQIQNSFWSIGGSRITSAVSGSIVTGHVSVTSSEAVDVIVRFSVRQDRTLIGDREMTSESIRVSLGPGQTRELVIDFQVESGFTVRGYFLKLEWPGGDWQQDGYPPRLGVQ